MTDVEGFDPIDPWRYAEKGYPHEAWTRLRREAPVKHLPIRCRVGPPRRPASGP
jgi:hypothetical protein